MNTQKLLNSALNGLDTLGFQLDSMGITSKVNRHNLAALIMHEKKHLEGEWESLQVRIERKKLRLAGALSSLESRVDPIVRPLLGRIARLRSSNRT